MVHARDIHVCDGNNVHDAQDVFDVQNICNLGNRGIEIEIVILEIDDQDARYKSSADF